MSDRKIILAMIVSVVVVLGGGWYLVVHDRTPVDNGNTAISADSPDEEALVISMAPLLVPESRGGRIVNIALLTIDLRTATTSDADRVRAAVPELRSVYKEELETYLIDRPLSSLEDRISDFTKQITEINNQILGENTIVKVVVDEPTAKPNDEPVPKKDN